MRVKIIDEGEDFDVENRINEFMDNPENKVKEVVDVKFSSAYADEIGIRYSALIMYKKTP